MFPFNRQTLTAVTSAALLAALVIALAVWATYQLGMTDDFAQLMRSALGLPTPARLLIK